MDVAGSAVGIASLGIQTCQGLLTYYNAWKNFNIDINRAHLSIADLNSTLTLLRTSLEDGVPDEERVEQIRRCLLSCEDALLQLSGRLQELRKHNQPEGLRQKARFETQRLSYPFRKETLAKLRENIDGIIERLKLAVQVLHLDISTTSQGILANVEERVLEISAQNQHILGGQSSDRFRRLVSWLSPPDPWTNHHSARSRCEPQTGAWLLQSGQYRRWKAGAVRHLWISGKAGCGKTVLCSSVVEDVRACSESQSNVGFAVFYFSFSDQQKQSYGDLLRSLVAQLAWKEPVVSMLEKAYKVPSRALPGTNELEGILSSSFRSYDKIFVILDALDESPVESADGSEVRQTLLDRLEALVQGTSNLQVLATSRELRDVQDSMTVIKAERISVASSAVDADIRRYLSAQLSCDRRLSRLDTKTRTLIEDTISTQADGMFRWAYCQLQELKKLKATKPKYVKDALRTLPTTLDATYERMLCGIEERFREEALTLLRWLAYAQSPLTLRELAEAAIVNPIPKADEVEVDIDNRGDIEDTLDILSGLVVPMGVDETDGLETIEEPVSNAADTVINSPIFDRRRQRFSDDTKVRLAHFSVKEYLESKRILDGNAKCFYLESAKEHWFLAQSCLAYLTCYSNDSGKARSERDLVAYPLLGYSARSWFVHASLQQSGDISREVLFLSSETVKRDWLYVHTPEMDGKPFSYPPERLQPIGSSLYYACCMGLERVVRALIDRGAEVNAGRGFYGNALQAASFKGREKIVQMLLDARADVHAEGVHYGSALQAASYIGWEKIVQMLLDARAEANAEGGYCHNTLQAASTSFYLKIIHMLLDAGAGVNAEVGEHGREYGNALHMASASGNEKVAQRLIEAGAQINAEGAVFGSALVCASWHGFEGMVSLLLENGADVNARGVLFSTALLAASTGSHTEIVRLLLEKGADVNAPGGSHDNALLAALVNENRDIVCLLLEKGADVNARELLAALDLGDEEIAKLLIDHGGNLHALDELGCTIIHLSARADSCEGIEFALVNNIDINMADNQKWTALHWAAYFDSAEVVGFLRQNGADLTLRDWQGWTPYQVAVFSGHASLFPDLDFTDGSSPEPGEQFPDECGSCGLLRLVGVQYHCTTCPRYDLCIRCYQDRASVHPGHEFRTDYRRY